MGLPAGRDSTETWGSGDVKRRETRDEGQVDSRTLVDILLGFKVKNRVIHSQNGQGSQG